MNIFLLLKHGYMIKQNLQYITANIQGLDYSITSIERQNRKGDCLHIQEECGNIKIIHRHLLIFQCTNSKLKNKIQQVYHIYNYRMSYSTNHKIAMTTFLSEFPDHISTLPQTCNEPIILGDINIP